VDTPRERESERDSEGTKRRRDGGFYLSDLRSRCTDTALFRRIIIMPLGTRAEREVREVGRDRKQQRGSSISLVFYDYTSYARTYGPTAKWR